MNSIRFALVAALAILFSAGGQISSGNAQASKGVTADRALDGVLLAMTPDQLPEQFRSQLRGDVKTSKGTAVLKQNGKDIEYTFAWQGMTSSVKARRRKASGLFGPQALAVDPPLRFAVTIRGKVLRLPDQHEYVDYSFIRRRKSRAFCITNVSGFSFQQAQG